MLEKVKVEILEYSTTMSRLLARSMGRVRPGYKGWITARLNWHSSALEDVEDPRKYCLGGFHPTSIEDTFASGRYKIMHKLGYGGSSTVWLARDLLSRDLVTFKIICAEKSGRFVNKNVELYLQQMSKKLLRSKNIRSITDHFYHEGPNGVHLCLISEFAGPNVSSMVQCPGRREGSKRLRGDLAISVAAQLTSAVSFLHSENIVHGGLS